MALWSNTDANTSAPKNAVASGVGLSANGYTLFDAAQSIGEEGNTTVQVFGVDTNEQVNGTKGGHAGWVLRTTGTGGRAGRVHVETLVAMGSMDEDAEDTVYKDTVITIVTQPQSNSEFVSGDDVTLSVVATSNPSATLTYQWYDVSNGAILSGNTATTLNVYGITTNSSFNVVVSAAGATSVGSANADITIPA
jgi:hypothetical protein